MDTPVGLSLQDVVLVGDAVHPLLPFSTQGVNSALVDAVTLARALARNGLSPETLRQLAKQPRFDRDFPAITDVSAIALLSRPERKWLADPPFPEEEMEREIRAIEEEREHD